MKRFIWLAVALLSIGSGALAQSNDDVVKATYDARDRVWKLITLNDLVPLLLTKDQIKAILPAIEEARENVRKVYANEYTILKRLTPEIEQGMDESIQKNTVPSNELLNKVKANISALDATRDIFKAKNVALVRAAFDKALNKGQVRTAINNLNPREFDATVKPEEMTDSQKEDMFIREIMLDPRTYELMVEMEKHMP